MKWVALSLIGMALLSQIACKGQMPKGERPSERYTAPNGTVYVKILPIQFEMGSDVSRGGYVSVLLSTYWIQTTEVTNKQFESVMGKRDRHPESSGDNDPATGLSIEQMTSYAEALSKQTKRNFRLPTSAEYEYAARGGYSRLNYPWGDENVPVDERALTSLMTIKEKAMPVASFPPNYFGLYDMVGNAREVILDSADRIHNPNGTARLNNPLFIERGMTPVDGSAQGGSFRDAYPFVWAIFPVLLDDRPEFFELNGDVGFRLVSSTATLQKIEVPKLY